MVIPAETLHGECQVRIDRSARYYAPRETGSEWKWNSAGAVLRRQNFFFSAYNVGIIMSGVIRVHLLLRALIFSESRETSEIRKISLKIVGEDVCEGVCSHEMKEKVLSL